MSAMRLLFCVGAMGLNLLASYCVFTNNKVAAIVIGLVGVLFFWIALEMAALQAYLTGDKPEDLPNQQTAEGSQDE